MYVMHLRIQPVDRRQAMHRAFTLAELMVVLGIIVILVTVLVVAVNGARESARVATTRATLTALTQAVVSFREDAGYLPPMLDESRSLMDPPDLDDPNIFRRTQGWYSITSPAEYLIGYGHHGEDGYGWAQAGDSIDDWANDFDPDTLPGSGGVDDKPDETSRLGIRDPGFDGVWTATRASTDKGSLNARLERFKAGKAGDDGPVLGPYMELSNPRLMGSLGWDHDEDADGGIGEDTDHEDSPGSWNQKSMDPATGRPRVYFPGEAGYDEHAPKVICDAWGSPIRYYRLNYPTGALGRVYPATQEPYAPSLSQFIALRPWEMDPGTATDFYVPMEDVNWGDFNSQLDSESNNSRGDSTTSYGLQTGEFAFLSGGPDRRINNWMRNDFLDVGGNDGSELVDDWHYNWGSIPNPSDPQFPVPATEEVNLDNIVEVGS
jgi:prepilin-type N-terminal cleavage/methylation domain-containing protein